MADVIGLINDISTSVKLAWIVALAWAAIQVMWYRRGRVPAGTAEPVASTWSAGHQFPSVTRPPETDPVEAPALYLFRMKAFLHYPKKCCSLVPEYYFVACLIIL